MQIVQDDTPQLDVFPGTPAHPGSMGVQSTQAHEMEPHKKPCTRWALAEDLQGDLRDRGWKTLGLARTVHANSIP